MAGKTTYDRIVEALHGAREAISPWSYMSPTDVASNLPGGGIPQAWEASGRARDALYAGNYGQAAREYGNMAMNMVPEASPLLALGGKLAMAMGPAIRAYHGSGSSFDAFDPDMVHWFSTNRHTAEEFGKNSMGLDGPNSSYFNATKWRQAKPNIYETEVDPSTLHVVDPMSEAVNIADQIGVPTPQTWEDAASLLDWASAQNNWIDEARQMGKSGVLFKNVGDTASGTVSDHLALFGSPNIVKRD